MKRYITIVLCGFLCSIATAAQEATTTIEQRAAAQPTVKTVPKKPAKQKKAPHHATAATKAKKATTTAKKPAKKPTAKAAATPASARAKTTTLGKTAKPVKSVKKPKATSTTASAPKTTRTKTTALGKTTKAPKKTTAQSKAIDNPSKKKIRAQKTAYSPKDKTNKEAATKSAKAKPAVKRVYRKDGKQYRRFEHLDDKTAQHLGTVKKETKQTIALNKPSRGYKTANHLTFNTQDGKTGQIVLDTHNLTAARAEKKKIKKIGQQSVEVFAGTDAPGKGLASIGEFPLADDNLQGTHNLEVTAEPNGKVTLNSKNTNGTLTPITEFSIHQ